jgi:hypothetical protein
MSWGDDGVRRYCIPSERVAAVRDLGSLFETKRDDEEDTFSMVNLRSQTMLYLEQPQFQRAAA